jgi:hypothetical protein
MIKVTNGFEGANPSSAEDVQQIEDNAFVIRPYSEDGDGNYKFAMLVRVNNPQDESINARFDIDWQDAEYNSNRDYVLLGRSDQWRYSPAQIEGAVASASVIVPPGKWDLALQPTFGLDRLRSWQRRFDRQDDLSVSELGRTAQDRPVVALELGPCDAPQNERVAILARLHPYETAGSFAADGALRWLLSAPGRKAASNWRVSTVLIANPDGVANGLCKRVAAGGPELGHEGYSSDDPTAVTLRHWLDEFKPAVLVDFHGWMYHYQDGFDYIDADLTAQVKRQLETSPDTDRAWKGKDRSDWPESVSLWSYARHGHGTRSLIYSFGWYGRTVPHIRRIGAAIMTALTRCQW